MLSCFVTMATFVTVTMVTFVTVTMVTSTAVTKLISVTVTCYYSNTLLFIHGHRSVIVTIFQCLRLRGLAVKPRVSPSLTTNPSRPKQVLSRNITISYLYNTDFYNTHIIHIYFRQTVLCKCPST